MFYLVDDTNRIEITADEYAELREHLGWLRARHDDDLTLVQAVRNAITTNQGCTTPVENFITAVLRMYVRRDGKMQPADANIDLKQFEEEFETLIESAQYAAQRYPQMLQLGGQQA